MDNQDVVTAAQSIWDLYLRADGATFGLYSGSLAGEDLYAVSIHGDRTQQIEESDVSVEVIAAFVGANLDLLADPQNSVGVWLNAEEGIVYLDISITVQERQTALALAREHKELAICHLLNLTVESVGAE